MSKHNIPVVWHEALDKCVASGAVTKILLHGPPDTGKSTAAINAAKSKGVNCYRMQCSKQQGIEDLLGQFVLDPETKSMKFVEGPIPAAMRTGGLLLLDEFDRRNPGHDSIYHSVLDDSAIAQVRLPNGQVVEAAPGFLVIATTNESPDQFTPALLRRFELKLWCGTTHPEALKRIAEPCQKFVKNWQSSKINPNVAFEASLTAFLTCSKLRHAGFESEQCAMLVFGNVDAAKEIVSALASVR